MGTTSLDNLKDLLGAPCLLYKRRAYADIDHKGAVDIKLLEDDIKYLEESYLPQAVIGHT